ncbi:SGNH/GDSL hydrolase family protein [Hymenobacter tibetensis]|uniref:SGNH/GDSL hydrolase family protein n=1 Tax=Hymenobacter tibetensis TaxID=497967 RepID=A0ABY4CZL8_9BACT|nr:SGNH/GDSL hydrolase family protein [Hymenobacter tibetensis]UOG75502.1 SGNH/GDSL hydrolase family protein [Hymenobacter tibetensis]
MLKRKFLLLSAALLLIVLGWRTSYQTAVPPINPGQWKDELRAFTQQDRLIKPPAAPLLFYGSSSIRMWKTLAADFAGKPVLNRGFGGSRFPDAIYFFDTLVVRYQPRQVILYEGDNDIAAGATPAQVFESFQQFEKLMRQKLPNTELLFLSIKPSLARWKLDPEIREANTLIRKYIEAHPQQLRFVDVGSPMLGSDRKPRPELYVEDGLHMTHAGYKIWTRVLAPYLAK